MVFGMGMIELGMTFSFSQLVMDDMIVNKVKKIIECNNGMDNLYDQLWHWGVEETGFSYLTWPPYIPGRKSSVRSDVRQRSSSSNMLHEAWHKTSSILRHYKPRSTSDHIRQKIKEIIMEAEQYEQRLKGGKDL